MVRALRKINAMEHHVPAVKVDMAVCNRQAELRSQVLTKIGPQIRIVFQIGRLIAEGHQLSRACPHRHEVPQPDVFGVREKTAGDVAGVKRGGEVGCIRRIYVGKESGQAEHALTLL